MQTPQLNIATFLQRRPDDALVEAVSKSAGARRRRRRVSRALAGALVRAVEVMPMDEERGRAGAEQCLHIKRKH